MRRTWTYLRRGGGEGVLRGGKGVCVKRVVKGVIKGVERGCEGVLKGDGS